VTGDNQVGWVAAWLVRLADPAADPVPSEVYFTPTAPLNVRAGAGTGFEVVAWAEPGDRLLVLEDAPGAALKLGQMGQWIHVRTPGGSEGYAAAWFVKHLAGALAVPPQVLLKPPPEEAVPAEEAAPTGEKLLVEDIPPEATFAMSPPDDKPAAAPAEETPTATPPPEKTPGTTSGGEAPAAPLPGKTPVEAAEPPDAPASALLVMPVTGLNVRSAGSENAPITATVTAGTRLLVLGDAAAGLAAVGQAGRWLIVQLPDGSTGWVAAWYVIAASAEDFSGIGRLGVVSRERRLALVPQDSLNVRGGPDDGFAIVDGVREGDTLEALEAPATVRAKLGHADNWLRVRTPNAATGWVAAWLVQEAPAGTQAPPEGHEAADLRKPRTTRITRQDEPVLGRQDEDAGEARALDFYHEPIFGRLPVVPPEAIVNFGGFGPDVFSYRIYNNRNFYSNLCQLHNGLDFGIPEGTQLCAIDWGVVAYAGPSVYGAGPFNVIVRHGAFVLLYGHLNANLLVEAGQIVGPGDALGGSGTAFGYEHLHLEMRRIDPVYLDRLASNARGATNPARHMSDHFTVRGWNPVPDHYGNPALFFDPPLEFYWEQYGWHHADWLPQDADRNGYPDLVARAGEVVPTAYDLYALSSLPPGRVFQFWSGSHAV
ncbi:MAG: SH3 domain-containing protein, partial [Anaerolineae bacterium]|nr:SH3 domain-containing protein [Anaerolineae bacterium]